jgi:hypothetical protein
LKLNINFFENPPLSPQCTLCCPQGFPSLEISCWDAIIVGIQLTSCHLTPLSSTFFWWGLDPIIIFGLDLDVYLISTQGPLQTGDCFFKKRGLYIQELSRRVDCLDNHEMVS